MAYKSARLTTEELHQVKHLMGGALTLLSLWSLLSLDVDSGWIIVAAMLAIFSTLVRPVWVKRIPPVTWRIAAPALFLVVGTDFLLHLPEFIPSLVRMVVLILLYRNFAPRRQRDDLQLILLCLFCLVISGVMTVSLLFAFQILVFTFLAMALLFVINLFDNGKEAEARGPTWAHFSWGRLVRRVWSVLDWRVLSLGTAMFGFVVLVSTLLFILTPRFDLNQAIPFMRMETQPMTGFSESVQLGDVTSIQNDNSAAIRIDLPSREALGNELYWRMLILDRYTSGTFRMSDSLDSDSFRKPMTLRELRSNRLPPDLRRGEQWTFYMEGGVSRYLAVPGDYGVLRFQKPQELVEIEEARIYRLDSVGQSVFSYQIGDLQFNAHFPVGPREWEELEVDRPIPETEATKYPLTTLELDLLPEERASLSEINASLRQGRSLSAAAYAEKVTDWLWKNFDYSLSPDGQVSKLTVSSAEGAQDPVVNWLRLGNRGHCELFASAFILLARDAGFPARLVVGFAGGSWNPVEDYFVLRNRDAHAWVEVLDRESKKWLRIDPTPSATSSTAEAGSTGSLRFETGWGAWADSLRILWYRRIVNFEQKDQMEMALSLKEMAEAFTEELSARMRAAVAEFKAWISQPFSAGNLARGLAAAFSLLSLYLLWRVRYLVLGLLFRLLRRPKALDPVRRQASRYLKRINAIHGDERRLPVRRELQALRFGPVADPEDAKAVFARAKKTMRQKT